MSAITTSYTVRVKWRGGYVDIGDGLWVPGARRRFIAFDAGQVETESAAVQIAFAQLELLGYTPRRSHSPEVTGTPSWPTTGDAAQVHDLDGSLTRARLVQKRVEFTGPDGRLTLKPTVGTATDEDVTRKTLAIRRMSNPTAGVSGASTPFAVTDNNLQSGTLTEPGFTEWSWDPVDETDGEVATVSQPMLLNQVKLSLTSALPDDLVVGLCWSADPEVRPIPQVTYLTMTAGSVLWRSLGQIFLPKESVFQVIVNSVGTATAEQLDGVKLTVQFRTAQASFVRDVARST